MAFESELPELGFSFRCICGFWAGCGRVCIRCEHGLASKHEPSHTAPRFPICNSRFDLAGPHSRRVAYHLKSCCRWNRWRYVASIAFRFQRRPCSLSFIHASKVPSLVPKATELTEKRPREFLSNVGNHMSLAVSLSI